MSKLAKALGLERPSGPLPPKFQPKISIRISCGRSKQILEFAVDIPKDGNCDVARAMAHEKLDDILQRLGILASSKPLLEPENAERNLPAEEEPQEKSP